MSLLLLSFYLLPSYLNYNTFLLLVSPQYPLPPLLTMPLQGHTPPVPTTISKSRITPSSFFSRISLDLIVSQCTVWLYSESEWFTTPLSPRTPPLSLSNGGGGVTLTYHRAASKVVWRSTIYINCCVIPPVYGCCRGSPTTFPIQGVGWLGRPLWKNMDVRISPPSCTRIRNICYHFLHSFLSLATTYHH